MLRFGRSPAVAAGSSGSSNLRFALARYKPNGALDDTFGGDGKVTTDFTPGQTARVASGSLCPIPRRGGSPCLVPRGGSRSSWTAGPTTTPRWRLSTAFPPPCSSHSTPGGSSTRDAMGGSRSFGIWSGPPHCSTVSPPPFDIETWWTASRPGRPPGRRARPRLPGLGGGCSLDWRRASR